MIKVNRENLDWLKKQIKRLNKKAEKLGCEHISLNIISSEMVEKDEAYVPFYSIEVDGTSPSYSGWKFLGSISHNDEANVFHCVPGQTIPEKYRETSVYHCDHCGHKRRRNYTYVIQNESGETKQVGKTCLKDFLGHTDVNTLTSFVDGLSGILTFENNDVTGHNDVLYYRANRILELAAISHIKSGEVVLDEIKEYLFSKKSGFDVHVKEHSENENVKILAKSAKNWIAEKAKETPNDYLLNASAAVKNEHITAREIGIVASIVKSYAKDAAKENAKSVNENSEYVGEIKSRQGFNLELVNKYSFSGHYGITIVYTFKDENENSIVWFCTNGKSIDIGDKIVAKATVKQHKEYRGVKQTIVNRLKIEE